MQGVVHRRVLEGPSARVIRGAFSTITADAAIDPVEAALLRMLGAVLDCPIPPM